ncbi:MAG: hypothetical protein RL701_6012 [Pseudomonadota bacterium]
MWKTVTACMLTGGLLAACQSGARRTEVLPGVESLVFAKRAFEQEGNAQNVAGGAGRVVDYQRYVPGGGVFVLSPPTPSGSLTNLTKQFTDVDIAGLDLSFDAKQVVFAMRHKGDDGHYHIYTARTDGSDKPKQLTFAMADDVRPLFVPGDRIAFVTNQTYTPMGTRADEYNHSRVVTQLATVSAVSGDADRKLCAQNLSHTADPFLLSDGTIGYSRWEHLGPVNDVKLFRVNPDCTNMLALAGQHGKDFNSIVQVREAEPGVFVGIATAREGTIQAGAVMKIDSHMRDGVPNEEAATFETLTPSVPTGRDAIVPSGAGRYRTPFALGEGKLLVSWADGDVSDRSELANTAPHFGIYLYDSKTEKRVQVYDDPKFWDMYAIPVRPRVEPPVRPGNLATPSESEYDEFGGKHAILGSINITDTSLKESIRGGQFTEATALSEALKQAEKVRIIEGFSSEFGGFREFGLTMHEGAAILGEVPVQKDKSWEAAVIPYLPYHLQAIDRFGLSIRSEGLWIQAMPGETRTCGGCHESRSGTASGTQGATAAQAIPLAQKDYSKKTVADRTELPWAGPPTGTLQQLFDNKCVSCHDGGAKDPFAGQHYTVTVPNEDPTVEPLVYEIPYLLLTSTPTDARYERTTVTYPASYVSLLYPSAMMGDSMVEGDIKPQMWVVPGSARDSKLIEKINATPSDGRANQEWAWKTPAHPEDKGVTLTPDERLMLIRMADLGGQFYTRKNGPNTAGYEEWKKP